MQYLPFTYGTVRIRRKSPGWSSYQHQPEAPFPHPLGKRPCLLFTWDTWPRRANHMLHHCGWANQEHSSEIVLQSLGGLGDETPFCSDLWAVRRWVLPRATSPLLEELVWENGIRHEWKGESEYPEGVFRSLNPTILFYGWVMWTNTFLYFFHFCFLSLIYCLMAASMA